MNQNQRPLDVCLQLGRYDRHRIGTPWVGVMVKLSSVFVDLIQLSHQILRVAQRIGRRCIPYVNDDVTKHH